MHKTKALLGALLFFNNDCDVSQSIMVATIFRGPL